MNNTEKLKVQLQEAMAAFYAAMREYKNASGTDEKAEAARKLGIAREEHARILDAMRDAGLLE